MTRPLSACALALCLAGCHWGFFHREDAPAPQPEPEPVDTVAPALEVRPGGGSYAAVQYVTVAADEPASVRYTLDGTDPAGAGSAAAHVAASPVFWIRIAGGTTVLRAVATDAAGNVSAPVAETYVVTLPPGDPRAPVLTVDAAPADPVPLLSVATVRWRSDEAVTWIAELGGDGVPGWGRPLASGAAAAAEPVAVEVAGADLAAADPATVWVHATSAAGGRASASIALARPEPVALAAALGGGAGCLDVAVSADGRRAFVTSGPAVTVLDADPSSATFDAVLGTLAVPGDAAHLAPAPGGAHLWVGASAGSTDRGGVYAVPVDGGALTTVMTTAQVRAPHVAVAPGGGRAWFIGDGGGPVSVDADPASATFGGDPRPALGGDDGPIAFAAGGLRMAAGRAVIDLDPASPTFLQYLGTLGGLGWIMLSGGPIASPGGERFSWVSCAYGCTVYAVDPFAVPASPASWTLVGASSSKPWVLAAPDGDHLLVARAGEGVVALHRAGDLAALAPAAVSMRPGWTVSRVAVAPGGRSLYVLAETGEVGPAACRLVRVPLR